MRGATRRAVFPPSDQPSSATPGHLTAGEVANAADVARVFASAWQWQLP